MKQSCEYRKLGDMCKIRTGKLNANAMVENGEYPFFTCDSRPYRIDTFAFDTEAILISGNGSLVGHVNYYKGKFNAYQRTYVLDGFSGVDIPYILHCLKSNLRQYIIQHCKGGCIPYITLPILQSYLIPVPSMAEQKRIVAELDLLKGVLEKQKTQLKELDNLAHAIFYDMFGDPIENPKGWNVKTMGEIGTLQRGSGLSKKDLVENGYPCILYGQIHTRFGAYTKRHIACIPNELVDSAKIAHSGNLIMAITSEDVEGSCKSTAWMGDYDIAVGSDTAIFSHSQNGIYVSYYTQTRAFYNEKARYARGFKVTHISTKEIASIPITLPPISLQQIFADKIQSIESQKSAINQSIAETQKLLDYTMDKYFG